MKQFLYRIQALRSEMLLDGGTEREKEVLDEHHRYLNELRDRGALIMAGRTMNKDPKSFGIVILQAEDMEQAQDIMNRDPAIRNRVFKAELFPFNVTLE